jgi:hypothetical protein
MNGETAIQEQMMAVEYFNNLGSKVYTGNQIQYFHGKSSKQQEKVFLHQKTGLTFKKEISKMLHLEHNYMRS